MFNSRVHTFFSTPGISTILPGRDVDIFVCAQYGWTCKTHSTLECCQCRSTLNVADIKTIKDLQCHREGCPFFHSPCPKSFVSLSNSEVTMETAFVRRLRSFQCYRKNSLRLPVLNEETRETLLNEVPNKEQQEMTDAMLLAACGWQLRDTRGSGPSPNFRTDKFCLVCECCDRRLPLKNYIIQNHPGIIPTQKVSCSLSNLSLSKKPKISQFSIDRPPPKFGSGWTKNANVLWEPASSPRKRKLEVESAARPLKKSRLENGVEEKMQENVCGKRHREESRSSPPEKKPDVQQSGKKRHISEHPHDRTHKRLRMSNGTHKHSVSRTMDPLKEHRPGCKYLKHFYYSTGSGEVPGWIHSIRCVPQSKLILKLLLRMDE